MKSSLSIDLDQGAITQAVEYLRQGELVAFPTETVYGLGADARNEKALKKLYAIKGRPANHPVIVHLASFEHISDWCKELPEYAGILAKHFWPGPVTLIVKKARHVSSLVTGGQDTIGIRVPAHPLAMALLKGFSGGIAAPSANRYGRLSATCAEHVQQEFGDEVSIIIDGGSCPIGIESTIIDVTGTIPKILRPGLISEMDILDKLGLDSRANNSSFQTTMHNSRRNIRVPGSDKSHYAPQTPLLLMDRFSLDVLFNQQGHTVESNNKLSYAFLAFDKLDNFDNVHVIKQYIQAPSDARLYARELYANLRKLDSARANYIIVEAPADSPEWTAILDRLKRASTKLQSKLVF